MRLTWDSTAFFLQFTPKKKKKKQSLCVCFVHGTTYGLLSVPLPRFSFPVSGALTGSASKGLSAV